MTRDAVARRRYINGSIWWSAPGVQMTFALNIGLLATALNLFLRSL